MPLNSIAVLPGSGMATQKVEDVHDKITDWGCWNTEVGADHVEPLNVKAFPTASNATQKTAVVQEMEDRMRFWSMVVGAVHVVPFQVRTPPWLSTAAQKVLSAQLTATRLPPIRRATTGGDQLVPLYATACPLESRAVHEEVDGHETDTRGA